MNTKKHRRLSIKERVIVQTLLEENKTKSFIAKKLNRSRSTVTREVNKWVSNPDDKYVNTVGQYTNEEVIKKYLQNQGKSKYTELHRNQLKLF